MAYLLLFASQDKVVVLAEGAFWMWKIRIFLLKRFVVKVQQGEWREIRLFE